MLPFWLLLSKLKIGCFGFWHKRGFLERKVEQITKWFLTEVFWVNWFISVDVYCDCDCLFFIWFLTEVFLRKFISVILYCDCLFLRKVEKIRIFISVIVLQLSLWSFDESKRRGKGWIAQFHSSFSILRQFLFFSSHIFGIFVVAIFTIFGKHVTIFLLA